MKKSNQIHVRVTPTTRLQWDDLCKNSDLNTQSALFRRIVNELCKENEQTNLKTEQNES